MNVKKLKKLFKKKLLTGLKPNDECFACNPRFAPEYLEQLRDDKGELIMTLPKNIRREKKIDERPDFWIYGDSYVGKSTFVDKFDDLLF